MAQRRNAMFMPDDEPNKATKSKNSSRNKLPELSSSDDELTEQLKNAHLTEEQISGNSF